MRPIKMNLTAFGPYRDTETIDFEELKDHTLFVISGNTGAGKTTIFDAISFALYGEASGEDRQDIKLMRSQFANDNTHTSVELYFELRGRRYRILRRLPHVKTGNKAATGHKYEFYEVVNDEEIPCVDRQIVTEINQKVERLLGLTKDQFSQIVMLPQGEFRKLLTSETENKEDILRRIFKTESYKWISDRLNIKRREAEEQFARERQARDIYITAIHTSLPARESSQMSSVLNQEHYNINQIIQGLEEEALFYKQEITNKQNLLDKQNMLYDQKLQEFHSAQTINDLFTDWDIKKKQLSELANDIPKINQERQTLEKANQASRIIPYEQQVVQWRQEEQAKNKLVNQAKENLTKAKENHKLATQQYNQENDNEKQRDTIKRDIDRLEQWYPIVKDSDDKKKEMAITEKAMTQFAQELKEIDDKLIKEKKQRQELIEDAKHIEEAQLSLTKKKEVLNDLRQVTIILRDYLKYLTDNKNDKQVLQQKEAEWKKAKSHYQLMEKQWIEGQAGLIALELHEGEPCPVCGSLDHPKRALTHDLIPTKEQLEKAKQQLEISEVAYREALTNVQSTTRLLQSKYDDIVSNGLDPNNARESYENNLKRGKELKQEVAELDKNQERLIQLRKVITSLEKTLEQRQFEREKVEAVHQTKITTLETQKALFKQSVKDIPEDIRTLSSLEQRLTHVKNKSKMLEEAWKQAQETMNKATETLTKTTSELEGREGQYRETVEKRLASEKILEQMCHKLGFNTVTSYLSAKKTDDEQKNMKQDIDLFDSKYETLKQQIKDFEQQLQGKERKDLEVLQKQLAGIKLDRDDLDEKVRKFKEYLEACHRLKEQITLSHQKVEKQEKHLEMIMDLYDVIRGQNSKKISFERYLQIEFLEQIVQTANLRLRRLTNGQYQLIRSERQESRGKQSGLGLDVYDAYTGQTRDVKTLSGGEKFHASLCLALGMADIIQSYQGGVSIDTMFIDEGFGSLDEESLTKAIDTLIELQKSGRMIGVISHVQELKQTIPAILEVKKTKEGYSKTRFIIK